ASSAGCTFPCGFPPTRWRPSSSWRRPFRRSCRSRWTCWSSAAPSRCGSSCSVCRPAGSWESWRSATGCRRAASASWSSRVADTTLAAYRHLLSAQVRSQTQYRASFAADVVGSVMFGVLDVMGVAVVFRVTPALGGFGFAEVFLMAALAGCAFAAADLVVGNVERLRQYVRSGLFDVLLVRPLSSLAQLAAMDVATRR